MVKVLVALLGRKFGSLSEELDTAINKTTVLATLERELLEAGCASSLAQFRKDARL